MSAMLLVRQPFTKVFPALRLCASNVLLIVILTTYIQQGSAGNLRLVRMKNLLFIIRS